MKEELEKMELGRIAFRVDGIWWVAYYALPDTMEGAHELGRIHMAIATNSPQRKHAFMELIRSYIKQIVPAFDIVDTKHAPEHKKSGQA